MLFNRFHRNHNTNCHKYVTRSSTSLIITKISFLLLLLLQNTYLITKAQADFGGEEGEDDFGEYRIYFIIFDMIEKNNKILIKTVKKRLSSFTLNHTETIN